MTKRAIIEKTVDLMNQLPEEKAQEISDFADFISQRHEELNLAKAIQELTSNSSAFSFLNDDEELYSIEDLKEVYNG